MNRRVFAITLIGKRCGDRSEVPGSTPSKTKADPPHDPHARLDAHQRSLDDNHVSGDRVAYV
jgi:hypothetical protein